MYSEDGLRRDKPHDGHARAGEVGLRRTTREPTEQGKATSCGGRGGKGQMKENIDQPHMLPIKTSGGFADHFVRLSHFPYYLLYLKKKRAVIFHLGERPFCLPR
jgi:hypothetical protein